MADFIQVRAGSVNVYDDYEVRLLADEDGVPAEMDRIVDKIKELAKRLAPKRTGVMADTIVAGREGDDWFVEAPIHYALYVEMGHRIVNRSGRTKGFKEPQPFLRPALDLVVAETNA